MNCLSSVLLFRRFPGRRLVLVKTTCTWLKMTTEHWWNDTDSGNPKYSEKTLFFCLVVHLDWRSDRTPASAVRSRRRIALANARPVLWRASKCHIYLSFDSRIIWYLLGVETVHWMLCRKMIAVYCDNLKIRINILCGCNADSFNVTSYEVYS
jgi:hypothetical protein